MRKQLLALATVALSVTAVSAEDLIFAYNAGPAGEATAVDMTGATVLYEATDSDFTESEINQGYAESGSNRKFSTACYGTTADGQSWNNNTEGNNTWGTNMKAYGIPMGFDFIFNGTKVNSAVIGAAAYMFVGNGEITYNMSNNTKLLWSYGESNDMISMGGVSGCPGYKLSYKTVGEAPNRMFVVEWDNVIAGFTAFFPTTKYSCQIQLCENGNINYVLLNIDGNKQLPECGLRAGKTCGALTGNYTDGVTYKSGDNMQNVTVEGFDGAGKSLSITYPLPVTSPTAQPTDLKLTATSTNINGEFTAAENTDHYLVLCTKDATLTATPEDGTTYSAGLDEEGNPYMLGNALIGYWGSAPAFSAANLEGFTDYNIFVFSANANGTNGPKYLTSSPLSGSAKTLPGKIDYKVISDSPTSIKIDFDEVPEGVEVMVVSTQNFWFANSIEIPIKGAFGDAVAGEPAGDDNEGTPDKPLSEAQVGDILNTPEPDRSTTRPDPKEGGEVIYIGKADEPLMIENLEPNSYRYFMVLPFVTTENGRQIGTVASYMSGMTTLSPDYQPDKTTQSNYPIGNIPQWWETHPATKYSDYTEGEQIWASWTSDGGMRTDPSYFYTDCNISAVNNDNPKHAELIFNPIICNDRHYVATLNLNWVSFQVGSTNDYGDWQDNDMIEISASTDNGETWESLIKYDKDNHPVFSSWKYAEIKIDLNRYHNGERVILKLNTQQTKAAGQVRISYNNWMTLTQEEFIAVPELRIDNNATTHNSAKISWFTTDETQNKFEVQYGKYSASSSEVATTSVIVNEKKELELTNLDPNTEYYVKVRAIVPVVVEEEGEGEGEGEGENEPANAPRRISKKAAADEEVVWTESEWSDTKYFRTKAIPNPADPTPAEADFKFFQSSHSVILTWTGNDELDRYELQYRTSTGEWSEIISTTSTMVIIDGLDYDTRYLVRLKAYGAREYESGWIQSNFTTPADDGSGINAITGEEIRVSAEAGVLEIEGAAGLAVAVYTANGTVVAMTANASNHESYNLAKGVYIVAVGNDSYKIAVK